MTALLGMIFGGALRLAPEILKWFDRKSEREHELKMFDKQLAMDKLKGDTEIQKGELSLDMAGLQALIESIKGQGQITGIKWIDALNASVRPVLTYWWVVILSTTALIAQYILLRQSGVSSVEAISRLWGTEEKTIVGGMINFWFLDRVLKYMRQ